MVDDDDDYMADLSKFLPTESTAPAVQGRSGKPSLGGKAKPPEKEKKKVVQEHGKKAEEVQRKEGLESAIPASNIGFKMLQQMGYTAGTALGKHGQGLLEPVNIDLKRSRTGLGRDRAAEEEQEAKARRAEVEAMRNRQKETALRADFQERRRDSWHSRKTVGDYRKACATYLQLEESSPTSASAEQPDKGDEQRAPSVDDDVSTTGKSEEKAEKGEKAEKTEEEEEEEEEITPEILRAMLQKLRDQYNYCLYCGYKYDSAAALLANCPGLEEDAH